MLEQIKSNIIHISLDPQSLDYILSFHNHVLVTISTSERFDSKSAVLANTFDYFVKKKLLKQDLASSACYCLWRILRLHPPLAAQHMLNLSMLLKVNKRWGTFFRVCLHSVVL